MRRHALVLLAASFGLFSGCQPEPPAEPPSETAQAPGPAPPDSLTEQD